MFLKKGKIEKVRMDICVDADFLVVYGPNFLGHHTQKETVLSEDFSIFTAISHTRLIKLKII